MRPRIGSVETPCYATSRMGLFGLYAQTVRWPKSAGRDRRSNPLIGIDWPFRDRDVMDALAAAPSGFVDDSMLPASLAIRRIHRNQIGTPIRRRGVTALITTAIVLWLAVGAAAAVACLTRPAPGWVILLPAAGVCIAGLVWAGRPWHRRADSEHLRHAAVEWPTKRSDLQRYPNSDVLEAEWDTRFGHADPAHRGAAALVWCEPNLVAIAQLAANAIRSSEVWSMRLLDEHNARVDLDAILREVTVQAHRMWRHHADTHLDLGPIDEDVWNQLVSMIDSLTDYQRALTGHIDHLLSNREIIRNLRADDPAEMASAALGLAAVPRSRGALAAMVEKELLTEIDLLVVMVSNSAFPVASYRS